MRVSIHQPNFVPWYPFFQKIKEVDIFVILKECQFEKNGYQNRFNFNDKWYTMSVKKGLEPIRDKVYIDPKNSWDKIKNSLSKFTKNEVTLNIKEVKKPETNASLVAENIAQQLVKRISYRRAMKRSMQSALRLGAKGIKVSISGRLGGNEIARTEWLREGSIPSHTLRADIDYAESEALTTYGIIGIKVWIYKGEIFSKEFSQETNKK